jgi:pyridoxamine 5'-phosphate oxidase family protein
VSLTEVEQRYLAGQRHGRLATVTPCGAPQVKPVGFSYNTELGTIDIAGFQMGNSAKYRNIATNPAVAFVVDDVLFEAFEGVRFIEIRGVAEAAVVDHQDSDHLASEIIRIHPRRVIALNIDPHNPGFATRDIATAGDRPGVT